MRYVCLLTDKGRDLGSVLKAMVKWGNKHMPGTATLEEIRVLRARDGR